MSVKEYAKYSLNLFFIITVLVNIAMFTLGSIYYPENPIGYDAFLMPVIYGLLSLIPVWITYSPHELSVKQLIFRKTLQLLSLEIILNILTFYGGTIVKDNPAVVISFSLSIVVVYIVVEFIEWILGLNQAQNLTKELELYKIKMTETD